ncbi:hypothetical protein BASA81_002789 [Batrachochytrium salamandrivorans]|nr:hypothetical protein BASA81_002789 [Batrachochytrium salamandrivorans]
MLPSTLPQTSSSGREETTLSPPAQVFLQCSRQLFHSTTSQEQRKFADEWLGKFQLSWEAWDVVTEVLKSPHIVQDERVLFLAAQTLNRKIRYDRTQLGETDQVWIALRSAVISHLMMYANYPVVATQLSLALVALLVQMETWSGGIHDLIQGLKPSHPNILLECLKMIPQEVDDQSLDVSNTRRYAFKMEMLDSSQVVVLLLKEIHLQSRVPVGLIMDCLTSWITSADVDFKDLVQSHLLEIGFQIDMNTIKDVESMVELLIESCFIYHDEIQMIQLMVPKILQQFGPLFSSGTSQQRNELARLFSQCCEAFRRHLKQEFNPQLVHLATQVYIAKDYLIARKVMYFWMDYLQMYEESSVELVPTLEILYQASFQRMLVMDDEEEEEEDDNESNSGDVDMLSEVEQHRYETGEIIGHLLTCGGLEFITRIVEPTLVERVQNAQRQQLKELHQIDALLRVFQSSIQYLQSNDCVMGLLQFAMHCSTLSQSTRQITCDIVSKCVNSHLARYPEIYLECCMQFILDSLSVSKCESHAARAFRELCLNSILGPLLAQILESKLVSFPGFWQLRRTSARVDCLEGLTRLYVTLSCITNDGQVLLFQQLVDPLWQQVSSALLGEDVDALNTGLDCITMVIQASEGSFLQQVPQEVILSKLWIILPLLVQVNEKAVEHVGRIIKHAFRTFPIACRPHGHVIIDFIVKRFRFHPVSGLLYIAGAFFQAYHACDELARIFPEVLAVLIQLSFDLVLIRLDAFIQFPDFVEDLYYLANRTMENMPEILVQFNDLNFIRLIGMAGEIGMVLEHREAFRSVAVFLENAIVILGESSRLRQYITTALEVHGKILVYNLINGLCGAQAAERVADEQAKDGTIAHVLLALFEFWEAQHFEHIVSQCLSQQTHVSLEMRVGFVPMFIKAAIEFGPHQVATVCSDFAFSARRRKLRVVKDK